MLLTGAHVTALRELARSEEAGQAAYELAEDDRRALTYRALELQGLATLELPRSYRLTYAGREALQLLEEMRRDWQTGALELDERGQRLLTGEVGPKEQDWRLLGSDVLAALQAAEYAGGRIGPVSATLLQARGLAEKATDPLHKTTVLHLNRHGRAWLDFARRYRPRLEIDGELANAIQRMIPGYSGRPAPGLSGDFIDLLEAMELITWSLPDGQYYALTALGEAVYEALRKGGYALGAVVLDEATLKLLALLVDRGRESLTADQSEQLQGLGFMEPDGGLTPAGEAALRAYALLQSERPVSVRTFALTEAEVEVLLTLQQLAAARPNMAGSLPDLERLRRELVERLAERYREIVARYGRRLEERSALKRRALELLEELRSRDEWFNSLWNLEELVASLEALELVRAERDGERTLYRLTPYGQRVAEEQQGQIRAISATAVKAVSMALTRWTGLATSWVERAREEGLVGSGGGVTRAGRLYAWLAEHCPRQPMLTREEAEVLVNLPETEPGPFVSEYQASLETERLAWALDKLEAHGLIERLADGQIVRTEAGQLLARAVSGATKLAHPITPRIVRLLEAMRQVGTLYVKERKVRLQPEQWKEVERLAGLGPQEFIETRHVARMGHYIGEVTLNEAGLEVLEAAALLQQRS
ncbi:MAG: DUF505 family protein [Thermogemmatispora sp.]|uniref:DUF505 domain-containing protein n=1 Tax=Thermogemmatispora sp. TaxID=1968838 RepID=UPI001D8D644C|nr:DUF505 domain-containing protein [Thermogemmatispora sp.]MBX5449461.1 DUF505 family protein [Thermogemmatispora sp.]